MRSGLALLLLQILSSKLISVVTVLYGSIFFESFLLSVCACDIMIIITFTQIMDDIKQFNSWWSTLKKKSLFSHWENLVKEKKKNIFIAPTFFKLEKKIDFLLVQSFFHLYI